MAKFTAEGSVFDFYPPGSIPPMTPFWPIPIVVACYLATVFLLQRYMKDKDPIKVPYVLAAHNFALSFMSLCLTIGSGWEAIHIWYNYGLIHTYCGHSNFVDLGMTKWAIWFYLSKYYELFDTIFLVLRKRDLSFLHVYHHAIVIPVCWLAVYSEIYMGWITSFNNAFVHIFMYYYYGLSALGIRVWWRKYITSIQILQFVTDMLTAMPYPYFYFVSDIPCRGVFGTWIVANLVGISFLFLFCKFYYENYVLKKPAGSDESKKVDRKRVKKVE